MEFFSEDALKLFLSVVIGCLIGVEREYRSKAAGLRTITLISIGSTLFTIISIKLGGVNNADRIAANIITGIGFLGAGVVFKDAFSVNGLTTATAIWATAALGMAVGAGSYVTAAEGLVLVLIVLTVFDPLQIWIDNFHQKRSYKVVFSNFSLPGEIENSIREMNLGFVRRKEMKLDEEFIFLYDVYGSKKKIDLFNSYLLNLKAVKSFEC